MKRRIGTINGKPIIEGDNNILTKNEISYTQNGNFINLNERDKNGNLTSLNGDYRFVIPHTYNFNCDYINYDKIPTHIDLANFLIGFPPSFFINNRLIKSHSAIMCVITTDHKIKEIRFKGKNCCGYFLMNKNGDSEHITINNEKWSEDLDDYIQVIVENFKSNIFIPLYIAANTYNGYSIEIIDSNDKIYTFTSTKQWTAKANAINRFARTIQESQWV